mmetsp:Transcript_45672/g.85268  ORF Transcript_45672/g.85268 Transcript_45672/m.85268 type:complete len:202 (+) Transcript_45672:254-859(+)
MLLLKTLSPPRGGEMAPGRADPAYVLRRLVSVPWALTTSRRLLPPDSKTSAAADNWLMASCSTPAASRQVLAASFRANLRLSVGQCMRKAEETRSSAATDGACSFVRHPPDGGICGRGATMFKTCVSSNNGSGSSATGRSFAPVAIEPSPLAGAAGGAAGTGGATVATGAAGIGQKASCSGAESRGGRWFSCCRISSSCCF